MPDIDVVTFGCRLNAFESEVMRSHARAAGLSDTIIVHSCAVTAEAERQARQAIRRARRDSPEARIVVTGCSAQLAAGRYAAMPEVDHVVGNAEKLRPETWRALAPAGAAPRALVGDIMSVRETAGHLVEGFDGRTRAFLQVQQGCDHRCTFCIIPYGRGPSRSVLPEEVVAQARRLVENGYRELVVTGVDITSYGKDLPDSPTLGAMLRRVLDEVSDLPRLRLSSIDPAEVDPDLIALLRDEPRLMPHLHLSVQAGDDMVLKRMKRRHLRADVLRLCERVRRMRPEIVFGADLIAGFPTETEAMFENSLRLVEEAGLTFLHVFPYSPRPGTPAARMPQVEKEVRKERAALLRSAGEAALGRFLAGELGKRRRVLVENSGTARTDHFAPVRLAPDAGALPPGTITELAMTDVADGMLTGCLAP
jgi:threonylcarbamoyladenosine tRNA methylthiotransferase MtaB